MRYSASCACGYETSLVNDEKDIDWDLLYAHQEFCPVTNVHSAQREGEKCDQ